MSAARPLSLNTLQHLVIADEGLRSALELHPDFYSSLISAAAQIDFLEQLRAGLSSYQPADYPELFSRIFQADDLLRSVASDVVTMLNGFPTDGREEACFRVM